MTLELVVSPEAEPQIEVIDSWWRANRTPAQRVWSPASDLVASGTCATICRPRPTGA